MDTTRRRSFVLAALTTLLLAACGGGTATSGPGGPGATSPGAATQGPGGGPSTQAPGGGTASQAPGAGETVDACALLTAADIEAVTGHETKTIAAGPQGGVFGSGCLWELIGERPMLPPTISLGVMRPGGKEFYDRNFKALDAGYERIDGLGDLAVDAEFGAVHVVSGDTFFQVQYIGDGGGDDSTAKATELARKVVANLGG